ncbi:hypothetical protein PR048_028270 [Dryococelus australis]|uniref:Nuclease HARBI1 n=1 Tax=Dryococelus australis TaxID=614101 RepID=A0ABQ9GIT9_9NEOP|nr:hypothetical protein PR048_028270 [Dryococelus australis]
MPYYPVADDVFPSSTYLMKAYPYRDLPADKRIFNYRVSRAEVVLALCVLHNFLVQRAGQRYLCQGSVDGDTHDVQPGEWRDEAAPTSAWFSLQRRGFLIPARSKGGAD